MANGDFNAFRSVLLCANAIIWLHSILEKSIKNQQDLRIVRAGIYCGYAHFYTCACTESESKTIPNYKKVNYYEKAFIDNTFCYYVFVFRCACNGST